MDLLLHLLRTVGDLLVRSDLLRNFRMYLLILDIVLLAEDIFRLIVIILLVVVRRGVQHPMKVICPLLGL